MIINNKLVKNMSYQTVMAGLRKARKERKVTLRALAEEIGMSVSNLAYIERGEVPLKLEDFLKICRFFDIDAGEFLDGANEEYKHLPLIQKWKKLSEKEQLFMSDMMDTILKRRKEEETE